MAMVSVYAVCNGSENYKQIGIMQSCIKQDQEGSQQSGRQLSELSKVCTQ